VFIHESDPWKRWLAWREFWDRWGPLIALAIPLGIGLITMIELSRAWEAR